MPDAAIDVRAGRDQDGHGPCAARKVARPVRHDVEEGPGHATAIDDPDLGEIGIVLELTSQSIDIAALDRCYEPTGSRVIGRKVHHGIGSLCVSSRAPQREYGRS